MTAPLALQGLDMHALGLGGRLSELRHKSTSTTTTNEPQKAPWLRNQAITHDNSRCDRGTSDRAAFVQLAQTPCRVTEAPPFETPSG